MIIIFMKKCRSFMFLIFCFIIGCGKNQTSIYSFQDNYWNISDSVDLFFNIADTSKTYDVSFFFRNTLEYPYRNLHLLTNINYLDSLIRKDTVQYAITDKYGRWLGKGLGSTRDNYFIFKENKKFYKTGEYKITLIHGMRKKQLVGCNKIGFKIKKHE